MKRRAVLGDVDVFTPKHGVDPLAKATLASQVEQQRQGLVGQPMLRVIEPDAGRLGHHALAAVRVSREEVP